MKKTVLLCMLTLVAGFVIGIVCNFGFIIMGRDSVRATMSSASAAPTPMPAVPADILTPTPVPSEPPLDQTDNLLLLARSSAVLEAMKNGDWSTLSQFIHPIKGVTFTPYSTVDPDVDLCFRPEQIRDLEGNDKSYIWGISDGKGEPIELTMSDYFAQYVFNADYTQAPAIGIDMVIQVGNALENVSDVFPDGRFIEYHFPELDPKNQGFDWCSLKLVFEPYQADWFLVGLIHSQWTA